MYSEVVCENVRKLEDFVEMASGGLPEPVNTQKVQDDVLKLWNVVSRSLRSAKIGKPN